MRTAKLPPKQREIEELIRKAERGDSVAQIKLGRWYLLGRGVTKDPTKAAEFFQKALAAGNVNAKVGLGILHLRGFVFAKDRARALSLWNEASAAGSSWALTTRALYLNNKGTESDFKEAAQLLQQAMHNEKGDRDDRIEACDTLASWYGKGKGVAVNAAKEFEYYQKGAELGSTSSKEIVGAYYLYGQIVKKDLKRGYELKINISKQ